jgi:2Fe-2S ferredoxin
MRRRLFLRNLDFAWEVRPESRLSCQLRIRDDYDGLVVRVPEHQG